MCNFKEEITNKTQFTGYKIACKKLGEYYSPCTGIEYKPGLITIPKKQRAICGIFSEVIDPMSGPYQYGYEGMIAIFKDLDDARFRMSIWEKSLSRHFKIVILKMTIQKTKNRNCWVGDYKGTVYIGPRIRRFKEISF